MILVTMMWTTEKRSFNGINHLDTDLRDPSPNKSSRKHDPKEFEPTHLPPARQIIPMIRMETYEKRDGGQGRGP